jgi:hypothetical protein
MNWNASLFPCLLVVSQMKKFATKKRKELIVSLKKESRLSNMDDLHSATRKSIFDCWTFLRIFLIRNISSEFWIKSENLAFSSNVWEDESQEPEYFQKLTCTLSIGYIVDHKYSSFHLPAIMVGAKLQKKKMHKRSHLHFKTLGLCYSKNSGCLELRSLFQGQKAFFKVQLAVCFYLPLIDME